MAALLPAFERLRRDMEVAARLGRDLDVLPPALLEAGEAAARLRHHIEQALRPPAFLGFIEQLRRATWVQQVVETVVC